MYNISGQSAHSIHSRLHGYKLWSLQRDSRREERRKYWQGKGSIAFDFADVLEDGRGATLGFPVDGTLGRPLARAQRPPVHELSEHLQCQPQGRQVRLHELQATIMILLSLPARCICHDMRACMPVGVGRAQCCYGNFLATERRLFAEHTLLSPVRVWRAKILPEGCRSLVPARKISSGTRHASKQQGIQHNRLERLAQSRSMLGASSPGLHACD